MGRADSYIPALKYGHRIYPENIAGALGLPSVGQIYYVDPGKSASGGGKTVDDAYVTIAEAFAAASADNDNVIIVAGTSATGRTAETDNITWSKRRLHMMGNGAPRRLNSRNGLGTASSLTGETTTAIFTVTANNCIFANMSFADFQDNNLLVDIQSDYNTFMNVHFQGMGIQASADDADARSLLLTGSEENEFINCTIGLDTVTRGAANSSLELTGSCPRNKFINCDFPIFADAATPTWVKADTGNAYERFLQFENCFFNNPDGSSSTTLTIGMDLSTTGNGDINLINCNWRGATDLANNYTRLFSNSPVVNTANQGLMIIAAT